jgi:cytochrome c peroxidase
VTPVGSTGMHVARNSMSLANLGYLATYTWANPLKTTLEDQALTPLLSDLPVELGIASMVPEVMNRLRNEPKYARMFSAAFPTEADPITLVNVTRALASFERTIISGAAPYDKYIYGGDATAMSDSALRGLALFNGEKTECYHCHNATNFTISWRTAQVTEGAIDFWNTGLYNVGGAGDYPGDNQGLYEFTKDPGDRGKFRVAPLRNIELSAPYMHDGSIATLEEVIAFYAAGGRNVTDGPHAGDGRKNPNKSAEIRGFSLTAQETEDLLTFLRSLTDDELTTNAELSNPWTE